MIRRICILLFFIAPLFGEAQQTFTRTFTTNDGLPSNTINCIFQDSVGRILIGTDAGIAVYDGLDFAIVSNKDGLASNDIRAITKDDQGNLWIACYGGGLTKYNGNKFVTISTKNGLPSNLVRSLYYAKTFKTLFVGLDDGFCTINGGRVNYYGKANRKLQEQHEILSFLEGKGFVYAFPFKDYRIKFYPSTGIITQVKDAHPDNSPYFWITSAIVTSKHDTVYGNKFTISSSTGLKSYVTRIGGLVFNLAEDANGNVWVPLWSSMDKGIVRFDGTDFTDWSPQLGLANVGCTAVLYDKLSNILWIGTDGKGLVAVPQDVFRFYPITSVNNNGELRKIFAYQGMVHLLMKDRIIRINPEGKFEVIPITIIEQSSAGDLIIKIKKDISRRKPTAQGELWRLPEFYDAAVDPSSKLWVSTTVGFYQLSPDLKRVALALPFDIRYGQITYDQTGNLYNWGNWLPNLDIIPDPAQQNKPENIHRYSGDKFDLPKDITKMVPIGARMLFSSLHGGLYLFDGKTFIHLNNTCPQLPNEISDVCTDKQGRIVYCTNTGEVGVGSVEGARFKIHHRYNRFDPACGRNFSWLVCDSMGKIFVGSNRGLMVITHTEVYSSIAPTIRFFSNSEGYKDCNVGSPVIDNSGFLWLASQDKVLRIDTKALSGVFHPRSTLMLTGLTTNDLTYNFSEPFGSSLLNLNDSKWRFPYRSNSLTFHFNNINPFNAEKDRFSVKLEGFDKSFREIGSDRKAVFTSLPAGKYSLIVRVNNLNTLQTQEKKLLQFKIRPPYWQSWWFYILIACALITLIFVFYREREKQLKRKAKADLETAELEMQALQAQMNPHFVFNVINSIQRYILERDAKNGTQLLGDFSRMIRQTFTLSSKKVITLQEEMAYLASYLKLEQERYANRFQFEFDLEQGLDPTKTHIPSMLIQPIVENGVKHGLSPLEGSSGMLSIRFSKINDQSLQCVIEDNGIGLEKSLAAKQDSSGHLSKALNITQRRIELFRKTSKANAYFVKVMDRSKLRIDQTGTIVSLIIPAQYS